MSTFLQTFLEISDGKEVSTSEGQQTINATHVSLSESGGLPKRTSDVFQSINDLQNLDERLACSWTHQMGHFSYEFV